MNKFINSLGLILVQVTTSSAATISVNFTDNDSADSTMGLADLALLRRRR